MTDDASTYWNPDKQTDRSNFDFVRLGRSASDKSLTDLSLEFLDIGTELGLPDDLPVPPKGVPGYSQKPDMEVIEVIRAGVAYALAIATGNDRTVWERYHQVRALMTQEWHKGADHERKALAERNAVYAREAGMEASRKQREAQVYFIQTLNGEIKIGMAIDPQARMRGLQTSHPAQLTMLACCIGGHEQERQYHARFAAHRLHGEWFRPAPEILAEIDRLKAA